jgi:hydrocephalus-inducing protein
LCRAIATLARKY